MMKSKFSNEVHQEWVHLYTTEMWSTCRIAERYGCCSAQYVWRWLKRLGVQMRTKKEAQNLPYPKKKKSEANTGTKNSNYGKRGPEMDCFKGLPDIDGYNYEFRLSTPSGDELHKKVYEVFNYQCFLCSKPYESGQGKFMVHHIDKNRLNNNLVNLVLLCGKCHKWVHETSTLVVV